MYRTPPRTPRSGISALVAVAALLVLLLLGAGGCGVSQYNALVSNQTLVEAKWSEIDNQYKRRFDLVPQLVETVKGAANFEKTVLTEVTEARASVGRAQLPAGLPADPAQVEAYVQAQQGLGSALSRLMVVVEKYPDLKASQNFLSLQDQLEGTENRIAVARRDYIDAVQRYNAAIRKFPANFIAGTFGFEKRPQLSIDEGEREVPKIDFGTGR